MNHNSGKSHFFGELMVEECLAERGTLAVCIREVQQTLAQSSKRLVEKKIQEMGAGNAFKVWQDRIETPGDGCIIFQGMKDHTAESIKSLEGFRIAWVEEAQTLSARSLSMLRPTIRAPQSELWFPWNPRRKSDAVDEFLRVQKPTGSVVVQANWRDNPWFPAELEAERKIDLEKYPERYEHIWEGGYAKAFEGAYFAAGLAEARATGRIGRVPADPMLSLKTFWDIGGSGRFADAKATILAQFIGKEIRVLGYVETVGQVLAYHVGELRTAMKSLGFKDATCHLPHDGVNTDNLTGKQFADHLRDAGFDVPPVTPNQGRGAAALRIEAVRRLMPRMWFNELTTEPLREALGFYHERKDENRNVGLGPSHDWCLAADTKVLTPGGWKNVQDILVHDIVMTPLGSRRVLRSGIVRTTTKWTTVKGILCTPEHRFFTSRGLVRADELSLLEKFWTRDVWGLSILAFLSATFRLGLKTAIIWATQEARPERSTAPCSYTAWCMRLCMAKSRTVMKSITSMMTRSIITLRTWKPFPALCIAAITNQKRDTFAPAKSAENNLDVIINSAPDAVCNASAPITLESNESAAPAYNLTVDIDECYFVRGDDGRAYLVSNSSHGADAAGLMCVVYEEPSKATAFGRKLVYPNMGYA